MYEKDEWSIIANIYHSLAICGGWGQAWNHDVPPGCSGFTAQGLENDGAGQRVQRLRRCVYPFLYIHWLNPSAGLRLADFQHPWFTPAAHPPPKCDPNILNSTSVPSPTRLQPINKHQGPVRDESPVLSASLDMARDSETVRTSQSNLSSRRSQSRTRN